MRSQVFNFMKELLFYPRTGNFLQRSSTEEALKRVETVLSLDKLKDFDSFVSMLWEFLTGETPKEHRYRYSRLWIDYLVIVAIRFQPFYFYPE